MGRSSKNLGPVKERNRWLSMPAKVEFLSRSLFRCLVCQSYWYFLRKQFDVESYTDGQSINCNQCTHVHPTYLFSFEGQLCTFSRVLYLFVRYFYNMYIVKLFEIVFSLNVKDTNIFPCLHNIRLFYNI